MAGTKERKKPRELNVQQQVFAENYAKTGKVDDSYMSAYPNVTNRLTASASGSRLLKDVRVSEYVRKLREKAEERTGLTVDWLTQQMRELYNRAIEAEDYSAAGQALNMLAKHLGFYETHNTQKRGYTQEDVERLKNELKEKGFDLNRLNDRSEN